MIYLNCFYKLYLIYVFKIYTIDKIIVNEIKRNSEWLDDYQLTKQESEAFLEKYFEKCLTAKSEPDSDGWITVKRNTKF